MRNELLQGELPLPRLHLWEEHYSCVLPQLQAMWSSLWHNYCANRSGTSAIYWMEEFGVEYAEHFIACVDNLQNSGWVIVDTTAAYSTITLVESKLLTFVSEEELADIRFSKRFVKYLPYANTTTQHGVAKVRANGKLNGTTLHRPGMEIGAKSTFTYDREALLRNLDDVKAEAGKGMAKVINKYPELLKDPANYGNVVSEIINYVAENEIECNMGVNQCDSRGRAIKSHLSKVANPVGFKAFRALLVIPTEHRKPATKAGQNTILLFVAELNGYKKGTVEGKLEYGFQCWHNGTLPEDVYARIWAQRLYKELYGYEIALIEGKDYYWSTPIELDAAASLLQYIGVLLGDKKLLRATNVLSDGELSDPWGLIEDVARTPAKAVLMQQVYGSSKNSAQILKDSDMPYTAQDIANLEKGLHSGAYGVANKLKEFIIGNANMQAEMNPVVWGETLTVPCNRFTKVGEMPVLYSALDSKGRKQTVTHWKLKLLPDLRSFKRWTMTGLIHALDARVINRIMQSVTWGIDIHDAVITNPENATTIRNSYSQVMGEIYQDRTQILNEYFTSVGIEYTPKAQQQWAELVAMVDKVETFTCSPWALK